MSSRFYRVLAIASIFAVFIAPHLAVAISYECPKGDKDRRLKYVCEAIKELNSLKNKTEKYETYAQRIRRKASEIIKECKGPRNDNPFAPQAAKSKPEPFSRCVKRRKAEHRQEYRGALQKVHESVQEVVAACRKSIPRHASALTTKEHRCERDEALPYCGTLLQFERPSFSKLSDVTVMLRVPPTKKRLLRRLKNLTREAGNRCDCEPKAEAAFGDLAAALGGEGEENPLCQPEPEVKPEPEAPEQHFPIENPEIQPPLTVPNATPTPISVEPEPMPELPPPAPGEIPLPIPSQDPSPGPYSF